MSSTRVRVIACVVSAVLAVVLVLLYTSGVRNQAASQRAGALARYGGETASVCVTTAVVAQGETFSERNVTTVDWLVDLLPEGAQTDANQVLGKVAASTMAANTPVSSVDLEAQVSVLDVPSGTAAVSVPCSTENAVGGALAPGSVVDVYLVSEGRAQLLCPGVRVLQTSAGASGGKLTWVTIAAKPDLVEAIVAAANLQRLSFVLPAEDVARATEQMLSGSGVGSAAADANAGTDGQTTTGTGTSPEGGDNVAPGATVQPDAGQGETSGGALPSVEGEPVPEGGSDGAGEPAAEGEPAAGPVPAEAGVAEPQALVNSESQPIE